MDSSRRGAILGTLQFPWWLVRGNLGLEECEHAGNYAVTDLKCLDCDDTVECQWLYHNDESSALTEKPIEELADALEFAVDYVDAYITWAEHDRRACACDACTWLRRAWRIRDSIGSHLRN